MGEQSPIIDGHVKLRDGKKVRLFQIIFVFSRKLLALSCLAISRSCAVDLDPENVIKKKITFRFLNVRC